MTRFSFGSVLLWAAAAATTVISCGGQPKIPVPVSPAGAIVNADPVAAIIERRPELQLADSQVANLRVLKRDLDKANRPLREELDRLGMLRGNESIRRLPDKPTREQQEKTKPVVDELRENNRRAREAALLILTAVQRTRLDSLDRASRTNRQQQQQRRRTSPPA